MELKTGHKVLFATAIATGLWCSSGCLHAAQAADIEPEVVANVWEENSNQVASVSLNGKEVIAYKGNGNSHSAEDRAEEIAGKLKDLIQDDRFDASKLTPSKDGDLATIKLDGVTVLKFETPQVIDGVSAQGSTIDQSLKVVNCIRTAFGAAVLAPSVAKADAPTAVAAKLPTTTGAFSGHASWYGGKFHGRKTSDGSRYNQDGLTAAHRWLPFGTKLLVRNRKTGDSCVVEVNDRGPFVDGRVIDLSRGAARQLNMLSSGVALVDCMVLGAETAD